MDALFFLEVSLAGLGSGGLYALAALAFVIVYKATRVGVIPTPGHSRGGVRITVEESNRAYRSGFVYLPHADTKRNYRRNYQYVGGGWWAWRQEG